MRYKIIDKQYRFLSVFDDETGAYIRTGILDGHGRDTGVDPFMASFPHLIDVGVMGHCIHGKTGLCAKAGVGCYQSGALLDKPNMTVEDFRWIAEQCRGRCNQLALGGRGDPDQHEHFEELLQISRENHLRLRPDGGAGGLMQTILRCGGGKLVSERIHLAGDSASFRRRGYHKYPLCLGKQQY